MSANRPHIETFGCRLNIWESEVMRKQAEAAGLQNAIIINTCAVTSEAEKQARQSLRKLHRDNPDAQIIVTGCAAQINPEAWQDMPEVSHVMGNHDKLQAESWQALQSGQEAGLLVTDVMTITETASHFIDSFDDRSKIPTDPQRTQIQKRPAGRNDDDAEDIGEYVIGCIPPSPSITDSVSSERNSKKMKFQE